jgi:hypothetical protein
LSRFITRGTAVRLSVLLVVATAAVSWSRLDSPDASLTPTASPERVSVEQPVVAGTTLAPAAVALPAPADSAGRTKRRHGHKHRAHKHRGHQHKRQANARRAAAHHQRHVRGGGRDISWPQCPRNVGYGGRNGLGQPMPDPGVRFVIVGLTNGRAFTPNPCLAKHLRFVRERHLHASAYAFAAYPTKADLRRYRAQGPYDGSRFLGRLKNAGHAGASYNIRTMRQHGFTTPHVWLDVEPSSSRPWSGRRSWNAAVVKGWVRAYRDAGYTVGVYSTPNLWRGIVGRMRLGLPEWRTAGPASSRAALAKCRGESIQGGRAVIAQWWTKRRDFDRICPGPPREETFAKYFHKW